MRPELEKFDPYLALLRKLPFVEDVRLTENEPRHGPHRWDAEVEIRLGGRPRRFQVELKRTPRLDYALINALRARLIHTNARWILFTPFVTNQMAARLEELDINYLDLAGNCRFIVDRGHVAVIQGRRPEIGTEKHQALGPAGFRVLFALLARPDLLQATVREVAAKAGVGKTAVAAARARLVEVGVLGQAGAKTLIVRPRDALDQWITGYRQVLRPKLFLGNYQAQERDPIELERRIEHVLTGGGGDQPAQLHLEGLATTVHWQWTWGGTVAAHRLTGHYRGTNTILHVDRFAPAVPRRLRVLPAPTGNLTIIRTPGPLAFDGVLPHTAHPLLVHTELLVADDERAAEAGAEILERFLDHLR